MSEEHLNILANVHIDEQASKNKINEQINRLQSKINKIKIDIDLPQDIEKHLNNIKNTSKQTGDEIQGSFKNISSFSGVGFDDLHKRLDKVRKETDKFAKITTTVNGDTNELKSAIIEYRNELGKLTKEYIKVNENGKLQTTSIVHTDDIQKQQKALQKVNNHIANFQRKTDRLRQEGVLPEKDIKNFELKFRSLSASSENLQQEVEELKEEYRNLYKTQQDYIKINEKKQKAELERTQQKRKELEKQAQAQSKAAEEEFQRTQKLGTKIKEIDPSIFDKDINTMKQNLEKYIQSLYGLDSSVDRLREGYDGLGNKIYDYTANIKKSDNRVIEYKGTVDKTTSSIYEQSRAVKTQTGLLHEFTTALRRIPLWMGGMTAFYFPLRSFQQGLEYIYEIDSAMTELRKVAEGTKEEIADFGNEVSDMAKELGVLTQDIIKSAAEFSRLGYEMEQSKNLAKEALLYANVGDMGVDQATESLISTIKAFGIEVDDQAENVREVVDLFNEVGNNFAISSEGIGEALKRGAASMRTAGNTIEETVAQVTAANAVVQDPKKVGKINLPPYIVICK